MKNIVLQIVLSVTLFVAFGCGQEPSPPAEVPSNSESSRAARGTLDDYVTPLRNDCTLCLNPGLTTDSEKIIREYGEQAKKNNCSFRVIIDPPRKLYTCQSTKVVDGVAKCNQGVLDGGGDAGACSCASCDCGTNFLGAEKTACWVSSTAPLPPGTR